MLDFLFFISFVNITVNNSIILIPNGNVYNVNFNLSLPPRTQLQNVTYFQNYSYFNGNYFTHFFLDKLSTTKQFSASANVIRRFEKIANLNSSKINSFLSPTEGIESNNPYIVELAKKITNNSIDDFEKVVRIALFVYKNISYDLSTVDLNQSALSTLLRKSGVCEGKARLFVALARAVGIPSRFVAGISVQNNSLGLHAWAEVYLGKWVEVDPTWFEVGSVDAAHIITQREGLNQNIYYETYGASFSSQSLPINSTSKLNKVLTSNLDFNVTYSSLSIPGNGKAIVVASVEPFYGADIFDIPACSQIMQTAETYSFFEPRIRNAIIEINATNQQGSWVCDTFLDSRNFFGQKSLRIEIKQPTTINKFYAKLVYQSLLPWQNQTIYITPTAYDNFTIANPCFLKKQSLFPGVTYSFSFPACSNFVYVASSQTFSKLTFSFQKPVFQISERIPKNIIEGNNFTIFIDIKTNATSYKLIIQQANKTKIFELSGSKSIVIESKAESNLLNLSIIYNNEVAVSKTIQLNISKPSFIIATKAPNAIVIGKNFTLALNVSTDFEGNYTLVVNYANQTKIKKTVGNSSFAFNFEATSQPIIVNIFYLSYNTTKVIQPNYIQQPQVFVKVITQANQTTLSFDFRNYAKNITIRIGNLSWFFNSENNSREEIKIFGYGNFVCNVTFQDILGNFYNASFSFSNPRPKTEETFFVVFVALIVAIVIFVFLYKLMHH
jgi:hypothetical protein